MTKKSLTIGTTVRLSEELWNNVARDAFETKDSKNTIISNILKQHYAERAKLAEKKEV